MCVCAAVGALFHVRVKLLVRGECADVSHGVFEQRTDRIEAMALQQAKVPVEIVVAKAKRCMHESLLHAKHIDSLDGERPPVCPEPPVSAHKVERSMAAVTWDAAAVRPGRSWWR